MPQRFSHQREQIYRAVLESWDHPTAEMVYQRLKPEMPRLSMGTVYRNLQQMAREGRLPFPMLDVNDADSKHLFDNRHGTGQSVWDAIEMRDKGMSAEEIVDVLMREKLEASIYITVDTLKYLKKGGRVTPAAAAIGTLLKIKPVLQIQGGKLDQYAKVMNEKVARMKMIGAMKHDFETRFAEFVANGEIEIEMAYTNCESKAEEFKKQVQEAFPNVKFGPVAPLPLSIACHIGDGALAIACARVLEK